MRHYLRPVHWVALALLLVAGCRGGDRADVAQSMAPPALIARGQVDTERGTLSLEMPIEGTVGDVAVTEGMRVTRGQRLLDTDATPARLDEQLAQARVAQALAQVRLLQPKVEAASVRATRLAQAAHDGAGDRQSADDAREAAEESRAELASARAGVSLARAEQERARYQVGLHVLLAPVDGDVLRVLAWPGMHVTQGVPVLTLLPSSARIVRAELSQEALSAIRIGTPAQVLSDDGRQTPLAPAHVLRIGRMFGQSAMQADPLQKVNERSVDCVLSLDPGTSLRVGQRVLVRFARPPAATITAKGQ